MTAAPRREADGAAALTEAEIADLFAPVAASPAIAIAVSGGADSLALLAAADTWRRGRGRPKIIVLTVDHGLSAGSDAVAAKVVAMARDRGLAARILTWVGTKPLSGIEAGARRERYRLLIDAAREAGATHLLTAHSLEDQAETFLMRLERGSGVFGLAAMRREIDLDGLVLFRPFLAVSRARLAATTAAAGLAAYDDPMNADPRFLRVRVRRLLPALAEAGLDPAVIGASAARLAQAADAIDAGVDAFVSDAVEVDPFAVAGVRSEAFAIAPAEVRFRLLVRLLQAIGGEDYPPRSAAVEALLTGLLKAETGIKRTLAGVVVERRPQRIRFYREAGRAGLPSVPVTPGQAIPWDHRFRIEVAAGAPRGLRVAALGAARPRSMARPVGLPAAALAALPALFLADRIMAVPTLGWTAPDAPAVDAVVAETVSRRLATPPRFPFVAESWSNPFTLPQFQHDRR
jgi:tRNA(Ile)-lysidine synthase